MGKNKTKRKAQKQQKAAAGKAASSKKENVAVSTPLENEVSEDDPPSDIEPSFDDKPLTDESPKVSMSPLSLSPSPSSHVLPDGSPKVASSPPHLSPSPPCQGASMPQVMESPETSKSEDDVSGIEMHQAIDCSGPSSTLENKDIPLAAGGQNLATHSKSNFYLCPPTIGREASCTLGRSLVLETNYYPIRMKAKEIHHYDIEITKYQSSEEEMPSSDKKLRNLNWKLNRKIFEEASKVIDVLKGVVPVYDGNRNFFTRVKLPIKERIERIFSFTDDYNPTHSNLFKIFIQPATQGGSYKSKKKRDLHIIDLEQINDFFKKKINHLPEETLLALGSIFRHCPSLQTVPVRHSFYSVEDAHIPVTQGLELWFGYNYSVHVGQDALYLNIDQAQTLFYPSGRLLDWISRFVPQLDFASVKEVENEIKNVKIYVAHLPFKKIYSIFNLTNKDCNDLEFNRDGTMIKLVDYYKEQYKIYLQHANLPAINVGNKYKNIHYPIELCYIKENQPYMGELTNDQRTDTIFHATISPVERFKRIKNHLKVLEDICRPILNAFSIEINHKPLNVPSRILSPPFLLYGNNKSLTPENGTWKTMPYYEGKMLKSWVVISFVGDSQFHSKLVNMIETLRNVGNECGMKIISTPSPSYINEDAEGFDIKNILTRCKSSKESLQLCVVILSPNTVKCNIKDAGDNVLDLPTICIKHTNVIKKGTNRQFLINICHKINIKLGGINYCLETRYGPDALKRPILVVGADVNHPSASNRTDPSVAAVVGNISRSFNHYEAQVKTQKTRLEIIADLKEMMVSILNAFIRRAGGRKPYTLLYFRDGVGEGQFEEVLEKELKYIKEACLEACGAEHKLNISIVIVQKRHHTRFSPLNPNDGVGKFKNIPPGTLIETGVTHPYRFEYFLCSHSGIQGTSIPTKYTLIHDENAFTPNDLCTLTYYLCYMYTRCTRSIAIPVVVQHAHHWALKGKGYYDAADDNFDDEYIDEDEDY